MAQPPSLNSNNPFRRKAAVSSPPAAPPPLYPEAHAPSPGLETAPDLPSADRFRDHLQALSNSSQPPPTTSFQKPRVVKKVRVQSPPPSSPESPPGASERFPPVDLDGDESSSSVDTDDQAEPFTYTSSISAPGVPDGTVYQQPIPSTRPPPPNPFQKTLRDLEVGATQPTQDPGAVPGVKGGLDVGAFGRLLLTGQTGSAESLQATAPGQHPRFPPPPSGDGASTTDASSISRQSLSDVFQAVQETPRTSRETSEQEAEDDRRRLVSSPQPILQPAPSILRKKPPPPSSRHGKLINPGTAAEGRGAEAEAGSTLSNSPRRSATAPLPSPSRRRPSTPSDVNKPLPPAPHRSPAEEASESVFDREAAGKVPESETGSGLNIIMPARPPTPPVASQAHPAKKPLPPPRRQPHGRQESRATPVPHHDDTDSPLRRSSVDSTRSRSSSLRANIHAPAPPPPRRPSAPSRASSSSYTSPQPPPPPSQPAVKSPPLQLPIPIHPSQTQPRPPQELDPWIISEPPPPRHPPVTCLPEDGSRPGSSSRGEEFQHYTPPPPLPQQQQQVHLDPEWYLVQEERRVERERLEKLQGEKQRSSSGPAGLGAGLGPGLGSASGKGVPPPPPPARNTSVRVKRPGGDAVSRRGAAKEGVTSPPPPPPPPVRHRGSSRGSVDAPGLAAASAGTVGAGAVAGGAGDATAGVGLGVNRAAVAENAAADLGTVEETSPAPVPGLDTSAVTGESILADLSALQREVDALRGQVEAQQSSG